MNFSPKKYKKSFDYSYTIGVYATIELLLHQPSQVVKIYIHRKGDKNKGVLKIQSLCKINNIEIELADCLIVKLSESENCYAIGFFKKYSQPISKHDNHVVLVSPSDMGNVGTIIRTMLGYDHLDLAIIKPSVDIFDPKVVRASQGALFQIRHQYFDSFSQYKNFFSRNYYPFMLEGKIMDEFNFQKPYSLIFGNEGAGLSHEYLKIGTPVKITQSDKIDSLNLSIAVGIALYENFKPHR